MALVGSVIPLFVRQIERGEPLTVTEPTMTCFPMSLRESADLVEYAFPFTRSSAISSSARLLLRLSKCWPPLS